jgi:hypothetical protein
LIVHPRIHERHPELEESDVAAAWNNALASMPRLDKDPNEYVAIGIDLRGRYVEMVAKRNAAGDWLIYHAKTPPTKKMKAELAAAWR